MRKTFQLKNLLIAMAVAGSTALTIAPANVQAGELSYNAGVSNMYLWRGINISNPSPVVSGGADYAFDSGFSVGTWTASEGKFDNSSEWDLYGAYDKSFGDFGVSLGYAAYLYPYNNKSMFKDQSKGGGMLSDYILGLSYKDLSLKGYFNTERSSSGNNMYITADYAIGKFGLHAGINKNDKSAAEYTEFNVSYAATDALTFTLSKAQGKGAKATVAGLGQPGDSAENPQLQVSYALPI